MILKGKRIFITGGAGFLGKALIKELIKDNEITVFSRDEAKHYFLKREYPKVNFICGDISQFDLLDEAAPNHDLLIAAASLKQIEAVDANQKYAHRVIVEGAVNSRAVAIKHNFEAACFVSTDKMFGASLGLGYGLMKALANNLFVTENKSKTKLFSVAYGNIFCSTGSLLSVIDEALIKGKTLTLYSEEMTRFGIKVEQAVELIEQGFSGDFNEKTLVPHLKSYKIKDVFDIYAEQFGLKYVMGKPRPGEKLHEIMGSSEDIKRMRAVNSSFYELHSKDILNELEFPNNEYSSRDFTISKDELKFFLEQNNWFRA